MFLEEHVSFELIFNLPSPVKDFLNDVIEAPLAELCLVLCDLHLVVCLRVAPHPLQGKRLATNPAHRPTAVRSVVAKSVALQVLCVSLHMGKEIIFVDII